MVAAIVVVFLVAVVGGAIWLNVSRGNARARMLAAMARSGFRPTKHFMSFDGKTGIALDSAGRRACLLVGEALRVVPFGHLLEVEVLEDGHTTTKTSTTSQAGRAIIGGLLLGPLGALVGAATAKKTSADKVGRIDVRVIVADPDRPSHTINVVAMSPMPKGGSLYKRYRPVADEWYAAITAAIHIGERDPSSSVVEEVPAPRHEDAASASIPAAVAVAGASAESSRRHRWIPVSIVGTLLAIVALAAIGAAGSKSEGAGDAAEATPAASGAIEYRIDDDADYVTRRCGQPDKDHSTLNDSPRPTSPTRTLTYRRAGITFAYKLDGFSAGVPNWKLSGITDDRRRKAVPAASFRAVLSKRLPCYL